MVSFFPSLSKFSQITPLPNQRRKMNGLTNKQNGLSEIGDQIHFGMWRGSSEQTGLSKVENAINDNKSDSEIAQVLSLHVIGNHDQSIAPFLTKILERGKADVLERLLSLPQEENAVVRLRTKLKEVNADQAFSSLLKVPELDTRKRLLDLLNNIFEFPSRTLFSFVLAQPNSPVDRRKELLEYIANQNSQTVRQIFDAGTPNAVEQIEFNKLYNPNP